MRTNALSLLVNRELEKQVCICMLGNVKAHIYVLLHYAYMYTCTNVCDMYVYIFKIIYLCLTMNTVTESLKNILENLSISHFSSFLKVQFTKYIL